MSPEEEILYPIALKRLVMKTRDAMPNKGLQYIGTRNFESAVVALSKNDEFATFYSNVASGIRAVDLRIEGDVTPGDLDPEYEKKQRLANDSKAKRIKFPYLKNDNLFADDGMASPMFQNLSFKENSCLASLIIKTFRNQCSKYGFDLTYESLWDICCPDKPYPDDEQYQLSLSEAVLFFQHYRLKLVAVDIFSRVIMLYDPFDEGRSRNTSHFSPYILRVLVNQGHAYQLNHDILSFDKKVRQMSEAGLLSASKKYHIWDTEKVRTVVVLHSKEAIRDYIQDYSGDASFVKILTSFFIESLMVYFQTDFGITGTRLQMRNGAVVGFQVEQSGVTFAIGNLDLPGNQPDVQMANKAEYDRYITAFNKVYTGLLTKNHLSRYHPQFFNVIDQYMRGPLSGILGDDLGYCDKSGTCVDINKAYTARMMELQYLPIGDPFCVFRPYVKGAFINDYRIYLVKCKSQVSARDSIIFDKTHVLLSGITLREMRLQKVKLQILYEWKPVRLVPNPMRALVAELWGNKDLTMEHKKTILNTNFGCLDKRWNTTTRSEFFLDKGEAQAKQQHMPGSEVMSIEVLNASSCSDSALDYGVVMERSDSQQDDDSDDEEPLDKQELYLVISKAKSALEEGFLPISFFKFDLQRLRMWEMYGTLEAHGLEITGINTDCLFVAHRQKRKLQRFERVFAKYFDSTGELKSIGRWKTETKCCRKTKLEKKDNALILQEVWTAATKVVEIPEEQEWADSDVFIKKARRLMARYNMLIKADYPGCGKTFIAKDFAGRRSHLFVHAYNKQKEEMKKESGGKLRVVTTSKLLGMGIDERRCGKEMDLTGIKVIVFDEILLNDRRTLWKMYLFIQAHSEIRFLATGDPQQLHAVENHKLIRSSTECLDILFPKHLKLSVIKRVKDEDDIVGYQVIRDALFEKRWSVARVVKEHGRFFGKSVKSLASCKSTYNLSFTNATRRVVNRHVFSTVLKECKVKVGQKMICKGYLKADFQYQNKTKRKALCVNREYVVKKISNKLVTLSDDHPIRKIILSRKLFDANFDLPYCATNHSVIGLTVDKDLTLFDWKEYNVSREWFWTAITRTTSLKLIHLYCGKKLSNSDLSSFIKQKIKGHVAYDMQKGVYDEKEFVTENWVMKELDRVQWMCNERGCELTRDGGNHQWSIDRIDNDLGHIRSNCRIICLSCNKAKH